MEKMLSDFEKVLALERRNLGLSDNSEFSAFYSRAKDYVNSLAEDGVAIDDVYFKIEPYVVNDNRLRIVVYPMDIEEFEADLEKAKIVACLFSDFINSTVEQNYLNIGHKFTILLSDATFPEYDEEHDYYTITVKYSVTGFFVDGDIPDDATYPDDSCDCNHCC